MLARAQGAPSLRGARNVPAPQPQQRLRPQVYWFCYALLMFLGTVSMILSLAWMGRGVATGVNKAVGFVQRRGSAGGARSEAAEAVPAATPHGTGDEPASSCSL
jgi:hypothetical protein